MFSRLSGHVLTLLLRVFLSFAFLDPTLKGFIIPTGNGYMLDSTSLLFEWFSGCFFNPSTEMFVISCSHCGKNLFTQWTDEHGLCLYWTLFQWNSQPHVHGSHAKTVNRWHAAFVTVNIFGFFVNMYLYIY